VFQRDSASFPSLWSFLITDNRMILFSNRLAIESTEHFPDFQAARAHVVSVLEAARGNIQTGVGHREYSEHVINGVPPNFFRKCLDAGPEISQLNQVEKTDGLWRLSISGGNGNSAILFLNSSYATVNVQLSGAVDPGSFPAGCRPR